MERSQELRCQTEYQCERLCLLILAAVSRVPERKTQAKIQKEKGEKICHELVKSLHIPFFSVELQ